jgi:HAD superfamily hydrolase (TIGR01509 family)
MHMTSSGRTESLLDLADRLHDRKSEIYRQMLIDGHVGLRPGIRRLIHTAKAAGITLAIATNSSAKNAETLLKVALGEDALDLFSTIVTCDTVIEKKPAAAVYLFVLNKLELEPHRCIALEDTRNGNLAALGAGLKTVITTHLFTTDNDFTGASLVVDQLGEPDKPAGIISGNMYGRQYVDLDLLDQLLAPSDELLISG